MKTKKIISGIMMVLALAAAFFSIHESSAAIFAMSDDANETASAIAAAKLDMQEMIDAGFNVIRVNDTISECEQLYDAQLALEEKTKDAEYGNILEKIKAVAEIKKTAFLAYDELETINESLSGKMKKSPDANFTESKSLLAQAQKEFYDERYEMCIEIVNSIYNKMAEAEAEASRMNTFYRAATYGIANFFKKNWEILSIIAAAAAVILLIMRKRMMVARLKKKLKKLELEKQVILDLIKKAQKDYFESGKLSEANYRIKTKKFSELVRDIDRQVPLVREELEKTKKKAKIKEQPEKVSKKK